MSRARLLRGLREAGPYLACGLVLWRMAGWEQALARWIRHGQRVLDAASADLADKATELHEDAVAQTASQN